MIFFSTQSHFKAYLTRSDQRHTLINWFPVLPLAAGQFSFAVSIGKIQSFHFLISFCGFPIHKSVLLLHYFSFLYIYFYSILFYLFYRFHLTLVNFIYISFISSLFLSFYLYFFHFIFITFHHYSYPILCLFISIFSSYRESRSGYNIT